MLSVPELPLQNGLPGGIQKQLTRHLREVRMRFEVDVVLRVRHAAHREGILRRATDLQGSLAVLPLLRWETAEPPPLRPFAQLPRSDGIRLKLTYSIASHAGISSGDSTGPRTRDIGKHQR